MRTVVACHLHSSPEPLADSASPSRERSRSAVGRSSSTPVTSAISTPSPASSASEPRSRRSPATSPIRIIAARCCTRPATRSICSSTTPASLDRARSRRSPTIRWRRCERVYEVNVFAPLALTQLALPRMPDGAAIINVTSDAAARAVRGLGRLRLVQGRARAADSDPRHRAPGAPRPHRRSRRHADADAPGGVPRRGHLGSAASGGERARATGADRR